MDGAASERPPARASAAIAYDPALRRIVLIGGVNIERLTDTWTRDGTTWTRVHVTASPPTGWNTVVAFDGRNPAVVLLLEEVSKRPRRPTHAYPRSTVVYRSDDRGLHWRAGAPLNLGQSGNEVSVAFANVSDGWAITLSGFYRTNDAGRSWTKIVTALTFSPGITLDFVAPWVGFALVPKKRGQALLWTDDAGQTWRTLWSR